MKKILPCAFILLALLSQETHAQNTRYIIRLKDKGSNTFTLANPVQYLSQKAVDRRIKYNIPIDSTDLPVTARYLDSIRLSGAVIILNTSKWLNQVAIQTTDTAALTKINAFPFVISAAPVAAFAGAIDPVKKQLDVPVPQAISNATVNADFSAGPTGYYNYGKSNGQVKLHQGDFLHNHGFRGEGMIMAMLDAGFYHYQTLPPFDSIRLNNQVLGTWDFVANETSVNEDNEHGMECLSTIAANMPGIFVGTAPKTSFYLYRTEDVSSEYPIEEQNWAAGIERADSLGVAISSTSLGYYIFDNPAFNYTYADMNGNTSISAKAADFAAKKGMLLVIAAGNTGDDPSWNHIITPADADSVLSVAAVDTTGIVASFSAYGPSSDGQIKPSVAAVGLNAFVANPANGMPIAGSGTSFACPNMAGLATCLWQAFPEVNNMAIIDALQKSGNRSGSPDNRTGYGIPDMKKSFVLLIKKLFTSQASINNCNVALNFSIKTGSGMPVELERKTITDDHYSSIHTFENNNGFALTGLSYADDLSDAAYGPVVYRLKMKIDSDTMFYVDSIAVNYTQNCLPVKDKIVIGPNPVISDLNIYIDRTTAAKIEIAVQNAAGQRVWGKSVQQAAGYGLQTISMAAMSKGIYFVTVFVNGKKQFSSQVLK